MTKRHNADIHTGNAKHKVQPLSGSTDSCISFYILDYYFSCFLFLCHPKGHLVLEIFYLLTPESELFTGDMSKDNHSPGPVFREVSP